MADLLSRAKAVSALLALLDEGTLGMTDLEEKMGGYKGAARPMAFAFQAAGLVSIHEEIGQFKKPVYEIKLTPLGVEVAKLLSRASDQVDTAAASQPAPGDKSLARARPLREGRDLGKKGR